jgi:hypothetical protein
MMDKGKADRRMTQHTGQTSDQQQTVPQFALRVQKKRNQNWPKTAPTGGLLWLSFDWTLARNRLTDANNG